jgi:acetoin utilization deacetylase AcuC-like enzyme
MPTFPSPFYPGSLAASPFHQSFVPQSPFHQPAAASVPQSPYHSPAYWSSSWVGSSPYPLPSTSSAPTSSAALEPPVTPANTDANFDDYGSMQQDMTAMSHLRAASKHSSVYSSTPPQSDSVMRCAADLRSQSVDRRTGLVYDERFLLHFDPSLSEDQAQDHPERPERLTAIWNRLTSLGLADQCVAVPGRLARNDELFLVHRPDHVTAIETKKLDDNMGDTYVNDDSPMVSRLAAGSLVEVVMAVMSGNCSNGLALIRPPGHHAEPHQAMGFCLYNNVAIAAAAARKHAGVSRVLILDWDVHHGNGTQRMFYDDNSVMVISLHRYDGRFYPGTGASHQTGVGKGQGFNVNVAWTTTGMGDAEYMEAFRTLVMPLARAFDPELVLVSAGFDAAKGDPLGMMKVTPLGYAHMTAELCTLASGRCVLALEGGYNCEIIAKCTEACLRVLLGDEPSALEAELDLQPYQPSGSGKSLVFSGKIDLKMAGAKLDLIQTKHALASFWPCCRMSQEELAEEYDLVATLGGEKPMTMTLTHTSAWNEPEETSSRESSMPEARPDSDPFRSPKWSPGGGWSPKQGPSKPDPALDTTDDDFLLPPTPADTADANTLSESAWNRTLD